MPKKAHGLGRGLDALLPEDESQDLTGVQMIDIGRIDPNLDQPRKAFSQESISLLAQSISTQGILQPILVVKGNKDRFTIVAGERRWRAAREAGLTEVPCLIREMDKTQQMEVALIENLQREDLNPLEVAQGIRQLMDQCDFTQEEVAKRLGKSRPAVANSLRLLSLSTPVMCLVETGELSAGHARALIPIEDADKQLEAAQEVIRRSLSVRSTERLAARYVRPPEEPSDPAKPLVDYGAEVSQELEKILGRKVRLVEGRQNGRIELEFYGPEDREILIAQLRKIEQ